MTERWARIPFFPNYEVSDLGNVRYKRMRAVRPYACASGYLGVTLYNSRRRARRFLHRLVALAFNKRGSFDTVNHKNGNKHDNCAANLEWTTKSGNTKHAWQTGLIKR